MCHTKTIVCSYNIKAPTYRSKWTEKASTSTNQRSILEMLWGNVDGTSANKNAECGENDSLRTLQEQNIETRSEFSEQETDSKSNDSDWEQASVNLSHNISCTPNSTLLRCIKLKRNGSYNIHLHFTWHLIEVGCAIFVTNTVKGMNIQGLLELNCMSTLQKHSNVTWKVKSIQTEKRKNKKSKIYWAKGGYTRKWLGRKTTIQKCQKEKLLFNKEIP